MATAISSVSPPAPAYNTLSTSKPLKPPSRIRAPLPFLRHIAPSLRTKSPFLAKSPTSSGNGASSTAVEDGKQSGDLLMSIDVLRSFIDLNSGSWKGSFYQFDCNGNLLHKISTKLAASSYGEDELMSLIQSLYIRQPPSSPQDKPEWFEYKIKETNMFTVDKYQQIGLFPKEKAFALRYQTAGMLETVLRQGVLGEDDTGEEFPRNLKLPSRRPAIVCENCLYSLEQDSRVRAFHIMDPKGVLEMLLVFLEERGSGVVSHPSFDNSKDSDRITPHLGTWKGHSVTKRSGVYGATIAEADTISVLEINEDGQLIQDIRSTSNDSHVTTSVHWTGSISSNLITFDGGFQHVLLPGGIYMGCPSDVAKSVQESKSFHLELCWLESPGKRQRLVRTYDVEGLAVSSTYFLETRQ
ncbi:glutamate NMDA receptor subunit epsilon-1 [Perilla frutescens var. frutescens]|nr:glutamate NMDA receptor subunit epsilon-1 [Perilla frutescens var. frutescens]